MFKSLRDRFRRAGRQAEAEIEPQLDLSYEAYRPEEREKGAVVQDKHLENVMWELELALLESDVAMEVVEALKAKLQQRLVGLRVASRGEIAPTIEKALKASLVELLSLETFDLQRLLVQDDGLVTEGSWTSVFVERDGVLATPPRAIGLLPGVLRDSLIAEGRAVEAELTLDDLENGFWIGNAVRGLMRARLI